VCVGTWENRGVPFRSPLEAEEAGRGYVVSVVGPSRSRGDGENLEENLERLVTDIRRRRFKPIPAKRVYIPKNEKEKRPLGISAPIPLIFWDSRISAQDHAKADSRLDARPAVRSSPANARR
jgi:hypothetical protein